MKTTLLASLCSIAFALSGLGQTPTAPPDSAVPSPVVAPAMTPVLATPPPAPTPAITPTPALTPTPSETESLERRIEKKVRKGVHISIGEDDEEEDATGAGTAKRDRDIRVQSSDVGDSALMAIPIVGIIFTTLFGAPVMIVTVILFFSYWRQRNLHRTVRMMVEKGQPVPEALFASPQSPIKMRSDMRRGVVLVMVGTGLMVFFGAATDWDGGAWALGLIPFLIGCGYLLVWKLESGNRVTATKSSTDNPPTLP